MKQWRIIYIYIYIYTYEEIVYLQCIDCLDTNHEYSYEFNCLGNGRLIQHKAMERISTKYLTLKELWLWTTISSGHQLMMNKTRPFFLYKIKVRAVVNKKLTAWSINRQKMLKSKLNALVLLKKMSLLKFRYLCIARYRCFT